MSAVVEAPTAGRKEAPGVMMRTSFFYIDPNYVDVRPGWNPRFDFGELEEEAKSIKELGLLNALRVKRKPDGRFEIVDGERRLTMIKMLLEWHAKGDPRGCDFPKGVPAWIVPKDQDDVTSLKQMFVANAGKSFLPLEEAAAYKRMKDAGLTIAQICEAVGRRQVHVVAMLALVNADDEVKAAVRDGTIGKTDAKDIAVAARGDKKKQKELLQQVKSAGKNKLARKQAKRSIERAKVEKAAKKGRAIKLTPLTAVELSDLGSKTAGRLETALAESELPPDVAAGEFMQVCMADQQMKAAYVFGLLQGLKVASGLISVEEV